jgi:hypothetical protein
MRRQDFHEPLAPPAFLYTQVEIPRDLLEVPDESSSVRFHDIPAELFSCRIQYSERAAGHVNVHSYVSFHGDPPPLTAGAEHNSSIQPREEVANLFPDPRRLEARGRAFLMMPVDT